jgi:hypothetical protein
VLNRVADGVRSHRSAASWVIPGSGRVPTTEDRRSIAELERENRELRMLARAGRTGRSATAIPDTLQRVADAEERCADMPGLFHRTDLS